MPYDDHDITGSWDLLCRHGKNPSDPWADHAEGSSIGRHVEAVLFLPQGCGGRSSFRPAQKCTISNHTALLMVRNPTRRPRPVLYQMSIKGVSAQWELKVNGTTLTEPVEETLPPAGSSWFRPQGSFTPIVTGIASNPAGTQDRVTVDSFLVDDEPSDKKAFTNMRRRTPQGIRSGDRPLVLRATCNF